MAVQHDHELTDLAAEILREAVQSYGHGDVRRLAASNLSASIATGAFPAVTGTFPAITGGFPELTGGFPAITGAFPEIGNGDGPPQIRLKKAFRLPRTLPAVRLPPPADLVALARSAPLMAMLEALARWAGRGGRLVTEEGDPSDADAAEVARWLGVAPQYLPYLWDYALAVGWLELEEEAGDKGRRAVIGETAWRWADGDGPGTLQVWATVFAAVLADTLDVASDGDTGASRKLEFRGQGVATAVRLFMTRRAGLSEAEVGDLVMNGVLGNRPSSRAQRAWDSWVREHGDPARWLLDELAALHAVTVPVTEDGTVGLTPLALWALREQLQLDGIEIRVLAVAPLRMSAADLVALADGVSDAEFEAETEAWIRSRGPEQAARELLEFAGSSGARPRLLAVHLTRTLGVDAQRAWRDVLPRPELRGYARTALSAMATELPESTLRMGIYPNPDDMIGVAADLLALACGDADPDPQQIAEQLSLAIPAGREAWIFGLMAQSSDAEVTQLLTALSRHHPDWPVATQARNAARIAVKNLKSARAGRNSARAAAR